MEGNGGRDFGRGGGRESTLERGNPEVSKI